MNTDNIADIAHTATTTQPDLAPANTGDAADEYMKVFDAVDSQMGAVGALVLGLKSQPHDEARVKKLIQCVTAMHALMSKFYDLTVEMNNFFGSKNI